MVPRRWSLPDVPSTIAASAPEANARAPIATSTVTFPFIVGPSVV